jgi:hypothetical protein
MVAHTLSYSNPEELRVRVTGLAEAAGWTRYSGRSSTASCLDGGDALVRRRVEVALGHAGTDNHQATDSNPVTPI